MPNTVQKMDKNQCPSCCVHLFFFIPSSSDPEHTFVTKNDTYRADSRRSLGESSDVAADTTATKKSRNMKPNVLEARVHAFLGTEMPKVR